MKKEKILDKQNLRSEVKPLDIQDEKQQSILTPEQTTRSWSKCHG